MMTASLMRKHRQRLAVAAFGNIDGVGALYTQNDEQAAAVLEANRFVFTDENGQQRRAFTRDEDYWRPWVYLDHQSTPQAQEFNTVLIQPHLTPPTQERVGEVLQQEV